MDDLLAAPTELMVADGSARWSVALSWTVPAHTAISGYRIRRGADADALIVLVSGSGDDSIAYTNATLEAWTSYVYAVQALSPDGDGARSETALLTVS